MQVYFHIKKICATWLSKKYLTCLPREHKLFWQLSRLDNFVSNYDCKSFRSWKTERPSFPGTFNTPSHFPEALQGIKLREQRNEFLQMFGENVARTTIAVTKKRVYIIPQIKDYMIKTFLLPVFWKQQNIFSQIKRVQKIPPWRISLDPRHKNVSWLVNLNAAK